MKTRAFFLVLWMLTVVLAAVPATQAQSPTIAYQGYLTDVAGVPVSGTDGVLFRLYDAALAGTQVWQERQVDVAFKDGVFSVQLGAVESLEEVRFDRPLWLSVAVGAGEELSPRVPLSAVPYAMGLRHLRVVPGLSQIAPSPSLIGGHVLNAVEENVNGATIGGGGIAGKPNLVLADFGTIGGGSGNQAGSVATVGGGSDNVAGARATVAGGSSNVASGERATIGGGIGNEASAARATVGGGANNTASGERSTIGGGDDNEATGQWASIGGGMGNEAGGSRSVVGGGEGNRATDIYATIGGGNNNRADGAGATIPGGQDNRAIGGNSFAAGSRATAQHHGTFVWADDTDQEFASTGVNQFLLRAQGGVGIGTNAPRGALHLTETNLGIDPGDVTKDALIIEGDHPLITLYGKRFQENTRSGLVLAGVDDDGTVEDRWGIVRQFFPGVGLHFTYGGNISPTQNPSLMSLSENADGTALRVSGTVQGERLQATEDLGAAATPSSGGVYRDNVVYAWAEVGAAGQFIDGFGCTVEQTSRGMYRLTLKRSLSNGISVIVTPRGLGSPFVASVVADGARVDVAMRRFNGATFDLTDNAFYVQVVGRP